MSDDKQNQATPALAVALGSAAWLRATADDQEEMLHAIGALDEEGERETKREILGLRIAADQVDELVVWVQRLVQAARKSDRNSDIAGRAMDYLKRERLLGSPLRSSPNGAYQPRPSNTGNLSK